MKIPLPDSLLYGVDIGECFCARGLVAENVGCREEAFGGKDIAKAKGRVGRELKILGLA